MCIEWVKLVSEISVCDIITTVGTVGTFVWNILLHIYIYGKERKQKAENLNFEIKNLVRKIFKEDKKDYQTDLFDLEMKLIFFQKNLKKPAEKWRKVFQDYITLKLCIEKDKGNIELSEKSKECEKLTSDLISKLK